jgi:hypothetical protein
MRPACFMRRSFVGVRVTTGLRFSKMPAAKINKPAAAAIRRPV